MNIHISNIYTRTSLQRGLKFRPFFRWLVVNLILVDIFLGARLASAIPIDDFFTAQTIIASDSSDNFSAVSSASALGGNRAVQVRINSGSNLIVSTNSGKFTHSQGVNTTGSSLIIWDGDNDNVVNPEGLGGLDLTSDQATAFIISPLSFDYPNQLASKIVMTIHSGPGTVLQATVVLDRFIINESITIPFSSFVPLSGISPASFENVGAITMTLDGNTAPATDLEIDFFGTNGICTSLPKGPKFVDECGVCNGDNSTCADCAGTPNGTKVIDLCGVCGGDNSSCKDCAGVPNGGKVIDACGVCGGNGSSCEDCKGVPNGTNVIGSSCNTGLGEPTCQTGKFDNSCICVPLNSQQPEICDDVDNDCDGIIDEGLTCEIDQPPTTDICPSQVLYDPYKPLQDLGSKEHKIILQGVKDYYFVTGDKGKRYKKFISTSLKLKKEITMLIEQLPAQTFSSDTKCACVVEDQSTRFSKIQRIGLSWIKLMKLISYKSITTGTNGEPCSRTPEVCLAEQFDKRKEREKFIRRMRNQYRRTQQIVNSVSTTSCN